MGGGASLHHEQRHSRDLHLFRELRTQYASLQKQGASDIDIFRQLREQVHAQSAPANLGQGDAVPASELGSGALASTVPAAPAAAAAPAAPDADGPDAAQYSDTESDEEGQQSESKAAQLDAMNPSELNEKAVRIQCLFRRHSASQEYLRLLLNQYAREEEEMREKDARRMEESFAMLDEQQRVKQEEDAKLLVTEMRNYRNRCAYMIQRAFKGHQRAKTNRLLFADAASLILALKNKEGMHTVDDMGVSFQERRAQKIADREALVARRAAANPAFATPHHAPQAKLEPSNTLMPVKFEPV